MRTGRCPSSRQTQFGCARMRVGCARMRPTYSSDPRHRPSDQLARGAAAGPQSEELTALHLRRQSPGTSSLPPPTGPDSDTSRSRLLRRPDGAHAPGMFAIDEAYVAAILSAFDQAGETAAAVELRRRFPGLSENAAREAARMIVRWRPPSQDERDATTAFTGP